MNQPPMYLEQQFIYSVFSTSVPCCTRRSIIAWWTVETREKPFFEGCAACYNSGGETERKRERYRKSEKGRERARKRGRGGQGSREGFRQRRGELRKKGERYKQRKNATYASVVS